ncbi:uncharacterized protein J8A68_002576 [[Candida] subhashii]|uniref:Uncharacterized protein n=1 Tax=[Candida] subhashii TaxID=561895 RepID=A0A8J5UIT5_9ASCO|nr:uncharacterized protein J8A68_002576 [[Candida] subhashii]KAG7663888.1 hypothetical protein J8A68_002576 [[Candida] subhashii]
MPSLEYKLEERSLSSVEDPFDYVNLLECKCDSCESWKHQSKRQTLWLFLGIVIPLLWIFNSIRILFMLFYKKHDPISVDQYLVFQNQKVFLPSNVAGLKRNENGHVIYHRKRRQEMFDGLGHSLLAFALYSVVVLMIVVTCYYIKNN